MKVLPYVNLRISSDPTLRPLTSRREIGMKSFFSWSSANRLKSFGPEHENVSQSGFGYLPGSRLTAGPRRSELIGADKCRLWDCTSKHLTYSNDLLEQAMRLAGIAGDEGEDSPAEEEEDLRLSGLSDLLPPEEMQDWDMDDLIRTPPPPFRPPPSPDESDGEGDDDQEDDNNDQDDDQSQRSTDESSQSAEDSHSNGDTMSDDTLDQESDHEQGQDDQERDDQDQGEDMSIPNNIGETLFPADTRPSYLPNEMKASAFCDLCDVPDRFRSWIEKGVPIRIDRQFSRRMYANMPEIEQQQAQLHIDALIKADLIETCGRSNFVSVPKVVPKGKVGTRLVIDYSHLTDFMEKTPFFLPSIYSMIFEKLPEVTGDQYLMKIDLASAFYHLRIRKEARHTTTFRWNDRY